jgi:nitroreductase
MLSTKEAIEKRRSIRRYKPEPVSDEHLFALLDAARLAPSGSNAQPWRFKIVRDQETKLKLVQASVAQAIIHCGCAGCPGLLCGYRRLPERYGLGHPGSR